MICLRIERILNNNIVSAIDEDAQELLILGKGLGFNSKVGDPINESKIEKVFELKDDTMDKFKMIVNEIPIQFLEVTDDIVKLFKMKTTKDISDVIYISLSDHLYFATQRFARKRGYRKSALVGSETLLSGRIRSGQRGCENGGK